MFLTERLSTERGRRADLIERSCGRHVCITCEHCPEYDAEGTTRDKNACDLFRRYEPSGVRYMEDGTNTRIYRNGIVTDDNGGGYWVIRCPFYREDLEWCDLLDIRRM